MTPLEYPGTRRDDLVEELHGQRVADPYRWLEDPDSAETAAWVERQNEFSRSRLDGLAARAWFTDTMNAVMHRPRASAPGKHGGRYFVSRNNGFQNQDVIYVADTLAELLAGGRVIIDPNTMSADGTTSVLDYTVSDDGALIAYAASAGGSDWLDFGLIDVASGEPVDDAEIQTKFSVPAWLPDNRSYLYCDFGHQGRAAGTETAALGGAKLRRHRIGEPQQADELLMDFPDDERLMFSAIVSRDQRFVVVPITAGTENVNRVWVYRIAETETGSSLGSPIRLIDEPIAEFDFICSVGDRLYFQTDLDAERGRVVVVDLAAFEHDGQLAFEEVVAQSEATLSAVVAAGDCLIAVGLEDARPALRRFGLLGDDRGTIEVPGGAVVALNADPDEPEFFLGVSSVVSPTTSFLGRVDRLDDRDEQLRALQALPELIMADPDAVGGVFDPPQIRTERRRAHSADGTEVPYFLISRADLDHDRSRPTMLYGYGGFKIAILAEYHAAWPAWLAAGGVLVVANLRGGGEFGTGWYEAGRLDRKQNVFDDFAAVGEDLIATGVTSHEQLALHGASNGGLLVGAMITQHPGLAAVALPAVGVLDLLRFHRFTIGRAWVSDYGNPDEPDAFATVLAYSPLHNVTEGTDYPATLVLTGDHDDRVVPLHSHKFTATLQRAQAADAPVLTRIETSTGHGAGKPTDKAVAETVDLLAFAAEYTGLQPA